MLKKNAHRWLGISLLYILGLILGGYCSKGFVISDNGICTSTPHPHYYLREGDVAVISHGGEIETPDAANNASVPSPDRCFIKIITCRNCHLNVSANYLQMTPCPINNTYRCDHLIVREPEYESSAREIYSVSDNTSVIFQSKTKMLFLEYFSSSFNSNFSVTVRAIKNTFRIKGHSLSYKWNYTGVLESPHFPLPYPSDYSAEYILENRDKKGFIQLIFSDFILSPYSYVEVFDSNGTKLDFFNGNSFRPPAITSTGPNLTINFKANDEAPNIGFCAQYFFINFYEKFLISPPITDCGGFVEDHGGSITMTNMAPVDSQQAFDCIWIIKPRLVGRETHLSVRVAEFENMESKSTLKIHEGLTSQSYLLETISSNKTHKGSIHSLEYVVHLSMGFYIRFQGYLNNESKIAIVYSAFRFDSCIPIKDYQCANGRCIKPILHCDGFNHCGDGSDETTCFSNAGTLSPEDANWWRTLTPNYYFPKQESSSGAGTNTLILITSLAGLGMFILTTALILVKLHKQKREDVLNREVLSTISGDIESTSSLRSNFGTPSDPPIYDPPPSYEDVVKFYFPPPPTYNSAVTVTQPGAVIPVRNDEFQSGVENAAFIPDVQISNVQNHPATQRRFLSTPLLTVLLPASRMLGLNSVQGTHADTAMPRRVKVGKEKRQSSQMEEACEAKESCSSLSNTRNEAASLLVIGGDAEEQPLPSYESACKFTSRMCDCEGACACSDANKPHSSAPTMSIQQEGQTLPSSSNSVILVPPLGESRVNQSTELISNNEDFVNRL